MTWGPSGALGCHVDAIDGLGIGIGALGMLLGCHGGALEVTWGPSGALGCYVDAMDGLGIGIDSLGMLLGCHGGPLEVT